MAASSSIGSTDTTFVTSIFSSEDLEALTPIFKQKRYNFVVYGLKKFKQSVKDLDKRVNYVICSSIEDSLPDDLVTMLASKTTSAFYLDDQLQQYPSFYFLLEAINADFHVSNEFCWINPRSNEIWNNVNKIDFSEVKEVGGNFHGKKQTMTAICTVILRKSQEDLRKGKKFSMEADYVKVNLTERGVVMESKSTEVKTEEKPAPVVETDLYFGADFKIRCITQGSSSPKMEINSLDLQKCGHTGEARVHTEVDKKGRALLVITEMDGSIFKYILTREPKNK